MFKKTLILLLSSFVSIAGSPEFLLASDQVELAGLDETKIVQTIIQEEVKPETVEDNQDTGQTNTNSTPAASAPVTPAPVTVAPVYQAPANQLNIAGRVLTVEYTDSTAVDAGGVVKFYNNRFLYGHNSPSVFGFLSSVGVGQTFSLTFNGVTTNYRVSNKVEYAKTSATTLGIDGINYKMSRVANGYDPNGTRHGLAIMTCSGTSYRNGDASHRLVLFADAI